MAVRKRMWRTPETREVRDAWIVVYRDRAGRRHHKTFDRKSDAQTYDAKVTVDTAHGIHSSTKVTVAEAGRTWLNDADGRLERSTTDSYRQHFNDHIVPYIGSVRLSELTVPKVREFEDRLRADKRSPAMIRRVIGDLGALLADAQERGLIAQNVVHSRSRNSRRKSQARRRTKHAVKMGVDLPAPTEIRAIVEQLTDQWRPLLLTAIFTGLRASELRGLRWSDVDLKKAIVHVRQRADRYNEIGPLKSAAARRDIPLSPIVVNALREWRLACPHSELDLAFPNGAGNIESHANIVNRGLGPVQVAAGVVNKRGKAKYPGLHTLRHFYASWCINRRAAGGLELSPKEVQTLLGHASIQMTFDTYGHLFPAADTGAELAAAERMLLG
jgi:integrase